MPFLAVHQTKRTKFLVLRIHLTLDIWVVVDCGDEPGGAALPNASTDFQIKTGLALKG